MSMGDCIGGTGFQALSGEDAAVVVDVIDGSVPLGSADPVFGGILGSLDVNAVGRTGSRAKKTGHTLFQSILITLKNMQPTKTLLEDSSAQGTWAIGIV